MADVSTREISLHGNRVSYRSGGDGPLLVLLHGITSSSASWEPVLPALAEHFTILAPDLLGHGQSTSRRATTRSAPTPAWYAI